MLHSFNTDIAEEVGVNAAIIYENIMFWCLKNKANNHNEYEGKYWTFNSVKAWKKLFPYLGISAIRSALRKLEEGGFILVGKHNEDPYDQTKWFSYIPFAKIDKSTFAKIDKSTIADIKPDNKQENFIPEGVSKESWNEFEEHRKQLRKPLTDLARKKLWKILLEHPTDQVEIIDTSIAGGWTGLFPLNKFAPKQQDSAEEIMKRGYMI